MFFVVFFQNVPKGYGIIFPTNGVEVTGKFFLAKLRQCLGKSGKKNLLPQRKIRSLRLSDALKPSSKQTKLHKRILVIYLFKIFLGLKTCEGFEPL